MQTTGFKVDTTSAVPHIHTPPKTFQQMTSTERSKAKRALRRARRSKAELAAAKYRSQVRRNVFGNVIVASNDGPVSMPMMEAIATLKFSKRGEIIH